MTDGQLITLIIFMIVTINKVLEKEGTNSIASNVIAFLLIFYLSKYRILSAAVKKFRAYIELDPIGLYRVQNNYFFISEADLLSKKQ